MENSTLLVITSIITLISAILAVLVKVSDTDSFWTKIYKKGILIFIAVAGFVFTIFKIATQRDPTESSMSQISPVSPPSTREVVHDTTRLPMLGKPKIFICPDPDGSKIILDSDSTYTIILKVCNSGRLDAYDAAFEILFIWDIHGKIPSYSQHQQTQPAIIRAYPTPGSMLMFTDHFRIYAGVKRCLVYIRFKYSDEYKRKYPLEHLVLAYEPSVSTTVGLASPSDFASVKDIMTKLHRW
jgi:hypothetical protein